jgi:hypothetical protein
MNGHRSSGEFNHELLRKIRERVVGVCSLACVMSFTMRAMSDTRCNLVTLEVSPDLGEPWQKTVAELRTTLLHSNIGCEASRLLFESTPAGMTVEVRRLNGEETFRTVSDPRDVVPLVLGLLATAPDEPPRPPNPAPPPYDTMAVDPHELPSFPSRALVKKAEPPWLDVIIGLSTGIRTGIPTDVVMWETQIDVDVLIKDWLVFALMRYAPLGAISGVTADTDAYGELGGGFGAGHRWRWQTHSLDVMASPSIVVVNLEVDSPMEVSGELAQLRIAAALRYGYVLGRSWRFHAVFDTEVAPSSLIKERRAAATLSPLLAWTAGLRLGASANLL